jgi:hypothetical protein
MKPAPKKLGRPPKKKSLTAELDTNVKKENPKKRAKKTQKNTGSSAILQNDTEALTATPEEPLPTKAVVSLPPSLHQTPLKPLVSQTNTPTTYMPHSQSETPVILELKQKSEQSIPGPDIDMFTEQPLQENRRKTRLKSATKRQRTLSPLSKRLQEQENSFIQKELELLEQQKVQVHQGKTFEDNFLAELPTSRTRGNKRKSV